MNSLAWLLKRTGYTGTPLPSVIVIKVLTSFLGITAVTQNRPHHLTDIHDQFC